eukprot:TRINITY_DN4300_c0_g1_i2.p1 TRINITY_DN4300_c0_g1~~TRINITY_DN4300_c0_g1_i2.p1  ORF type:complete len:529 (+),score=75.92 TRINITY_DN4300_c0_g1_i2:3-1589(+)
MVEGKKDLVICFFLFGFFYVCSSQTCGVHDVTVQPTEDILYTIKANGATLPSLLYHEWIYAYTALKPSLAMDYDDSGSSAGLQDVIDGVSDWVGSDVLLTDEELNQYPYLRQYSILSSKVVAFFNLPGYSHEQNLVMTVDVLAKIFAGVITYWDDAEIVALNNGAVLPSEEIIVIVRSDGSGTTQAFTEGLSSSPFWTQGKATVFPESVLRNNSITMEGNLLIKSSVLTIPYSISYTGPGYIKRNLPYVEIQGETQQITFASDDWPFKTDTTIIVNIDGGISGNCTITTEVFKFLMWMITSNTAKQRATYFGFAYTEGSDFPKEFLEVTCNVNGVENQIIQYNPLNRDSEGYTALLIITCIIGLINLVLGSIYIFQAEGLAYKMFTIFMLLGTTCCYVSCIFWLILPDQTWVCQTRLITSLMGISLFILSIGTRLLQIFRFYDTKRTGDIHSALDQGKQAQFIIFAIGPPLLFQIIFLVIWSIADPYGKCVSTPTVVDIDLNVLYNCELQYGTIWLVIEMTFLVLFSV